MKTVVVSGVTGMDGSIMVDYLLKNTDYQIYGCVRRISTPNNQNFRHNLENPRFKLLNFDLTDPVSVEKVLIDIRPDYFINFAAQSFVGCSWEIPKLTWDTNATGVLYILEAIRKHSPSTRFYSSGTSEEFGDVQWSPQGPEHPLRPRSPYGAAKAAARHLVKVYRDSYDLYAIQGWLFNHEGTRRSEQFVTRKITKGVARIHQQMLKGKSFEPIELGNMSAARDWSDAEDFVDAIWRMLNQEEHNEDLKKQLQQTREGVNNNISDLKFLSKNIKDYVCASDEVCTVADFVEKAFDVLGIDAELTFNSESEDWSKAWFKVRCTNVPLVVVNEKFYRPAEVQLLHGDSSLIRKELGWQPKISLDEMIRKMVMNDVQFEKNKLIMESILEHGKS